MKYFILLFIIVSHFSIILSQFVDPNTPSVYQGSYGISTADGQMPQSIEVTKNNIEIPLNTSTVLKSASTNILHPHIPNQITPDMSKIVGQINIIEGTTPIGGQTYSIPIEAPSGRNGCQPNISVVYNSMSGNGILGRGWGLSGLSMICRGNRNIYYDNKTESSQNLYDDPFYLDGERLLLKSHTTSENEYISEQSKTKVKAYLSGDVVKYFKIFYTNGTVAKTVSNYSNRNTYPVIEKIDIDGNVIDYSYYYYNNRYRLNSISYGQNENSYSSHFGNIYFKYKTRSDVSFFWQNGIKMEDEYLLESIECKDNYSIIRKYTFSYINPNVESLLKQVSCNVNGSDLNPIVLYYGEDGLISDINKSTTYLDYYYSDVNVNIKKGYFDAWSDKEGLIIYPAFNPYYVSGNDVTNQMPANQTIRVYHSLDEYLTYSAALTAETGFVDILSANIDEIAGDEIIKVNMTIENNQEKIQFKIYRSAASAPLFLYKTVSFYLPKVLSSDPDPKFFYTGDFNGDGKCEIFATSSNEFASSKCYIFDLESESIKFNAQVFDYNVNFQDWEDNDLLFPMDYDGDGKTDICHIRSGGTYTYSFNTSGNNYYSLDNIDNEYLLYRSWLNDKYFSVGEFNGDGKPDFLLSPKESSGSTWRIYYNKGNGRFDYKDISLIENAPGSEYELLDLTGDGCSDLVCKTESGGITVYPTEDNIISSQNIGGTEYVDGDAQLVPTIISNGSLYFTLIAVHDGLLQKVKYSIDEEAQSLLTGAVTSHGVIMKTRYQKMDGADPYFYSKSYRSIFPYKVVDAPLYLTAERQTILNGEIKEHKTYSYSNGIFHHQGLGFRGFESITETDEISYDYMVNNYDPTRFGVLTSQQSVSATVSNIYNVSIATDKTANITLTSSTVNNIPNNTSITKSYLYNSYGLPNSETINYESGVNTITSYTYNNVDLPDEYIIGLPESKTVIKNAGSDTFKETTTWIYTNNKPTSIKSFINNNQVSQVENTFDNFGNLTSQTEKQFNDPNTFTTSYIYDYKKRYRVKTTDPLGHTLEVMDRNEFGQPTKVKDFKSHYTTYTYDNMGRPLSINLPGGETKSYTYNWDTSTEDGLYLTELTSNTSPASKKYTDAFGRTVKEGSIAIDGNWIFVDTEFDDEGRLYRYSTPYLPGDTKRWTTYGYDSYNRVNNISDPAGSSTVYNYSGNSTTITNNGRSKTKTLNNRGDLISSSDNGGTIIYEIRADGQPKNIFAPGGIQTGFLYDMYGRRTTLNDPSAGICTYEYNQSGKLSKETNAKNEEISYLYDNYNRVSQKTTPEFITTYSYNSDGNLSNISSTNNTSTSYTYNNYLQLTSITETTDTESYTESYSYVNGKMTEISCSPINYTITRNYNQYNHLASISGNGSTLWTANSQDAFGNITNRLYGNGIEVIKGFNAYGRPEEIKSIYQGSTILHHLSYNFNNLTGNLSSRSDNKRNLTESFLYDNQDRLTHSTIASITNTVKYKDNGNIDEMTGIGAYEYSATKPYATIGITNDNNTVSSNIQNVLYTSFMRPAIINENGKTVTYKYNSSFNRVKTEKSGFQPSPVTEYSFANGKYQKIYTEGLTKERLYVGGSPYDAPVVVEKDQSGYSTYFLHRDYQGSILFVTDSNGAPEAEYSYTTHGRMRNPANWQVYTTGQEPELMQGRGYTGHEHIAGLNLINMNARLYDSSIGRFLSPDPYVQAPDNTQSMNRYTYCMNNPLTYSDPTGEKWWHWGIAEVLSGGLVSAAVTSSAVATYGTALITTQSLQSVAAPSDFAFQYFNVMFNSNYHGANQKMQNFFDIETGLFITDENANFGERLWQFSSRHSWELLQTSAGNAYQHFNNILGNVDRVDHLGGITFATNENADVNGQLGITLGNYVSIDIDDEIEGDFKEYALTQHKGIYMHEYGHTIQGRHYGPAFLHYIGTLSLSSANKGGTARYNGYRIKAHALKWYEREASWYAMKYFNKYYNNAWSEDIEAVHPTYGF